jgi:hypothetical protein
LDAIVVGLSGIDPGKEPKEVPSRIPKVTLPQNYGGPVWRKFLQAGAAWEKDRAL